MKAKTSGSGAKSDSGLGAKSDLGSGPSSGSGVRKAKKPTWLLVVILVVVIGGGILFMFAVSGRFGAGKVRLDAEYYAATSALENQDDKFLELLSAERYDELAAAGKSFVLFVDQTNCVNADRMRGFVTDYAVETGLKPYRMMFAELKRTGLHDTVKYYPSTVVVAKGRPVKFLDASADEDAEEFNDYEAFKAWLDGILQK